MRVLHLIPSLGGGGAERQLSYLARGMCRQGVDVHVATPHDGVYRSHIAAAGATIHHLAGSSNYDPRLLLRILDVVDATRPDVIQTWLTQADVLGGIAALTRCIPWVLSEWAYPRFYVSSWKNVLRHSLGRFASVVVANSDSGISYWRASRAKKLVISNAVDVEAIDAATPATIDAADSQRVVLYAGRLEPQKNVETLVPALSQTVRTRNAIVLVCGEGRKEREMRAQIENQGCSDRFRMLGFAESVWPLMKRADVLVSPSWGEGCPNVVVEAAIARCPIVVSDIPEHRAFLDDSTATFAPPGDYGAFARAVEAVLDDPQTAQEKARRARAAVEGWSIERITGEYLKIYEDLVT